MPPSQIEAKSEQNRKVADLAPDEDIGTKRVIFSVGPSKYYSVTGKSLSEALIFASTNPQYDNMLNYKFKT